MLPPSPSEISENPQGVLTTKRVAKERENTEKILALRETNLGIALKASSQISLYGLFIF